VKAETALLPKHPKSHPGGSERDRKHTLSPRLLDLFCGAGGAAVGYYRAGFDVVGVDINPQPHYPFKFMQGDALEYLEGWLETEKDDDPALPPCLPFDAIHASPPCQAYTTMNNRHGSSSPPLIATVRTLLSETGAPWVIENVGGALSEMQSPITLTGAQFGLNLHRPRLFEASFMLMAPPRAKRRPDAAAIYGRQDGRRLWTRADGTELHVSDLATASDAMGIDWMTWDEIREAIPPAFTEFVGTQLMRMVQAHV
jgi:DNA (cytosine-5)-methyltransferase 1